MIKTVNALLLLILLSAICPDGTAREVSCSFSACVIDVLSELAVGNIHAAEVKKDIPSKILFE